MFGPCPHCRRHVRVEERACPFCGGAVAVAPTPAATLRLTRAAIMAFTTSLGVAAVGCPRSPEPVVQPYGAPPTPTPTPTQDAGAPDADPIATPPVTPPVALYGAPPAPNQ